MSAVFWIVIGVLFLLLLAGSKGKGSGKRAGNPAGDEPVRIDRTHYYDPDDHECSVCGARFEEDRMVCPECGARFAGTKEDEDEFIDEMIFWEDDEDEDENGG